MASIVKYFCVVWLLHIVKGEVMTPESGTFNHENGMNLQRPLMNNIPYSPTDFRPHPMMDLKPHQPLGLGPRPSMDFRPHPMHFGQQFHDSEMRPMAVNRPPPINTMNTGERPETWDQSFGPAEWQNKPGPALDFNFPTYPGRPMPGKAAMTLLSKLMNGKYRLSADAFHVDAIPVKQNKFEIEPMLFGIGEMPYPGFSEISSGHQSSVLQNMVSLYADNKPRPNNAMSSLPEPTSHVVPFDTLLNEYEALKKNNEKEENKNKVSFAKLYQSYLIMLEEKHKNEMNNKTENATTPVPTQVLPTSTTPDLATTTGTPTTVSNEPETTTRVAETTEEPVTMDTGTPVPIDLSNFDSFVNNQFSATYSKPSINLPGIK